MEDPLKVHVVAPQKDKGITWLIDDNISVLNTRFINNRKLEEAGELIDELELDMVAHNKYRVNAEYKENKNDCLQLF